MNEGTLARILQAYGIDGRIEGAPQKGYRNSSYLIQADGIQLNLMVYKSEAGILQRIHNANSVGAAAAEAGLPARQLADTRILSANAKISGRAVYVALYNYLPGKTIAWEAYSKEHIKQLGAALAHLHQSLKRYNVANLPDVTMENIALNRRMMRYFNSDNVAKAMAHKLAVRVKSADFTHLLKATQRIPRRQALHMDFVRGNILFKGKTISGIIDFEKTSAGSPLFDIARTLAFLLVDCKYKPEDKIRKYFLRSGYTKRGGEKIINFTLNGQNVLEQLINFFLLHDFYKFLRHNPYESLAQNEHYIRTEALLLKRRLIAKV